MSGLDCRSLRHLMIVCLLVLPILPLHAEEASEWHSKVQTQGIGGVYFLAEPGEFWVEVEKQDLNRRGRTTYLRAILVGPDRSVIDEQFIPDDGVEKGPGPVQRVRLSTHVPRKGIYALNITVTEDRYGDEFVCGIRTNCPKYLIETSRGHRDAPHEEPIVLASEEASAEVCFQPRRGAFSIEASGIPAGVDALTLCDATGATITTIPVTDGSAKQEIPADNTRAKVPWRLQFQEFKGTLQIDGVTRWSTDDDFPNLSLWTPDVKSWFEFPENRWLLTPYHRTVYGEPGSSQSLQFEVYNNDLKTKTIALELEGESEDATLSAHEISLKPGQSIPVHVQFTVPKDAEKMFYMRVTPSDGSDISTYSSVHVRPGIAPATKPLDLPLVLHPYQHENAQFGYLPTYPLTNQPYFDMENRPVITSSSGISVLRNGTWHETTQAAPEGHDSAPFQVVSTKVAFDADNDYYALATQGGKPVLLHSSDRGEHYTSFPIPGHGIIRHRTVLGTQPPGGAAARRALHPHEKGSEGILAARQ